MVSFIASKPTIYQGIKFRSRLEARWAIFLDHYPKILKWGYEAHHFIATDSKGIKDSYTPDFSIIWTPYCQDEDDFIILEIKPVMPNPEYLKRLAMFVHGTGKHIIIGTGDFYHRTPKMYAICDIESEKKTCLSIPTAFTKVFPKSQKALKKASSYRFDL